MAQNFADSDLVSLGDSRAPTLGEHTDTILAEIGYAEDEIAGLRQRAVI